MTYEIYRYIFFGGAALAGIMLIIAVLLFIFLHIPTVIGDLTASNARKAIEEIRNQNASSGDKTYKSSAVNRGRAKLTDRITESGRLVHNSNDVMGGAMATTKLDTEELLESAAETTLLDSTIAENEQMKTGTAPETSLLSEQPQENVFEIEYEITLIHTDEVIN